MTAAQGTAPVLPDGAVHPSASGFAALAQDRRVIPVVRRYLVDGHTPVGLYRALADDRPGTFLLESAEHGGAWGRYSFIGVRSAAMLAEVDGAAAWVGRVPAGLPAGGDPLAALRDTLALLHTDPLPGLPPLTGGLVGMIGYDAVRRWEAIPDANPDELGLPELAMLLVTDLAVFDHTDSTVWLIANAINYDASPERADEAYTDACRRLDAMADRLAAPIAVGPLAVHAAQDAPPPARRTSAADYQAGVRASVEHIRAGDAFQIVLSQRFSAPCTADALDVYRILRGSNPSPYLYLFRIPDPADPARVWFDIVGSSPEALVTVAGGRALMHPIAGTRPRGATPEQDADLAEELLADEKERAEHLMLVDLGRNDLGRVCSPGTVGVVEFMTVERYSHVMHIVSTVVGDLAPGRSGFDALAATFPAGTLSGAPKVRAMEIIDDLEPVRRGLYGGVVGYLDFAGDVDTAIAIRTAVITGGTAYVQAGAGLVADSDPVSEDQECSNKAAAVLRAVAVANRARAVPVAQVGRGASTQGDGAGTMGALPEGAQGERDGA
jgi:anthranilate synthase component 1